MGGNEGRVEFGMAGEEGDLSLEWQGRRGGVP